MGRSSVNNRPRQYNQHLGTSRSVSSDVRSIAKEIDFKSYVEAVTAASQRTRSTIYVLMIAFVTIFAAFRYTTTPDWLDSRLYLLEEARDCAVSDNCSNADKYTAKLMSEDYDGIFPSQSSRLLQQSVFNELHLKYNTKQTVPSDPVVTQLDTQIQELLKLRTQAFMIQLPLIGVFIDQNDLALFAGIVLVSIFYVLRANMTRETDNIRRAIDRATCFKPPLRQDNLEILMMSQVLSTSWKKSGSAERIYEIIVYLVPVIFYIYVFRMESQFINDVSIPLEGTTLTVCDSIIELAAVIFIPVLSYSCWKERQKMHEELQALEDAVGIPHLATRMADTKRTIWYICGAQLLFSYYIAQSKILTHYCFTNRRRFSTARLTVWMVAHLLRLFKVHSRRVVLTRARADGVVRHKPEGYLFLYSPQPHSEVPLVAYLLQDNSDMFIGWQAIRMGQYIDHEATISLIRPLESTTSLGKLSVNYKDHTGKAHTLRLYFNILSAIVSTD